MKYRIKEWCYYSGNDKTTPVFEIQYKFLGLFWCDEGCSYSSLEDSESYVSYLTKPKLIKICEINTNL